MISKFSDEPIRDSGIVYGANMEQIEELYSENPELAGELAISILELTLKGTLSTNNSVIRIMLKNLEKQIQKDHEKWEKRAYSNQKRTEQKEEKMVKVADLLDEGYSPAEIVKQTGYSRTMVYQYKKELEERKKQN